MSPLRLFVLVAGPPMIVGGLYALTGPDLAGGSQEHRDLPAAWTGGMAAADQSLDADCAQAAAKIRGLLDAPASVLVRPPYVLAGNVSEPELARRYDEVIVPLERALGASYFDYPPRRPITIVMLRDEASFRRHSSRLDGPGRNCYAGYYLRDEDRIVLNLATGDGTLAHELTHALIHFDFPGIPEWFDEGLAALHEESEFTADGLEVIGLPNWRGRHLAQGYREGSVRSLAALVRQGQFRPRHEALDYAHARYLCLYLQQRRMLAPFYRKFRTTAAVDPTGERALLQLFGIGSLDAIETEFRRWAQEQIEAEAAGL